MLKTKLTWVRWLPQLHLPGHAAWWRLSGFWCRHLSSFEMVFGSARSWSFPMSWAARSSNLLSPSSFIFQRPSVDVVQPKMVPLRNTQRYGGHMLFKETTPTWWRPDPGADALGNFEQDHLRSPNHALTSQRYKQERCFEVCFGACFPNKLVNSRGVLCLNYIY